jgi:hypothetical protein
METTTPPPVRQQNGLAVTSLVLGICSLFCACLTGIAAVITGHIALNRANRDPLRYGGKGLAIAGLCLGYFFSLFGTAIQAGLLLPALAKGKSRAQQVACVNHLKQVALSARIYATDNGGKFPSSFLAMSNELVTPKLLVCPGDKDRTRAADWSTVAPGNISYEFVTPGLDVGKLASPGSTVIIRCPVDGNEAMADGSVQQKSGRRQTRGR